MVKKTPKTLDEENAEKLYGGVSPDVLASATERLDELNAEKATLLGEISACQNAFEKQGGNKAAFKFVNSLEAMEPNKREDFMLAVISYAQARDLFPQMDLFNQFPGQAAQAQAGAEASTGADTTAH